MPIYSYKCTACEKTDDIKQKMSDPVITRCPFCQEETFKRVLSKEISIQFKGSGFYITDYGKPPSSGDSSCGHGGCGSCKP